MKLELLRKITNGMTKIEIVSHTGLITEFAIENRVDFLVRGIRSYKDLQMELDLSTINRDLVNAKGKTIETVFLPSDAMYSHVSSSLIRELAMFKTRHEGVLPKEIENEVYDYLINN